MHSKTFTKKIDYYCYYYGIIIVLSSICCRSAFIQPQVASEKRQGEQSLLQVLAANEQMRILELH